MTRSRRLFASGEDVAAYSGGRAGWVPRPVRALVQGQQVAGGVVALGGVVAAALVVPVTLALAFLPIMPAVVLGWVALRLRRSRRIAWW